ncbi:MAG: sugar ABC transporter permease [Clostridiales bacterium]|jgi:raffinose/stachyose/melibiose transport system permease protein|nr:sugar ABC transporter permease [Clostridiales bacterium]
MDSMLFRKKKPLFLFFTPALIFMSVFLYYPFIFNVINSVMSISGLGSAATGINDPWYVNYVNLFTDKIMLTALKNTFITMGATVVFQLGIALVLALLVDGIPKGAQVFRTVYFFPIVISATALGLLFNLIFLYDGGMINNMLKSFGMQELIDWKGESLYMVTMLTPVMWQYVGFYFVIIVTGLNNISSDIYEAAAIDGASGFKRIRYISLPLIYNVLCTCLILAITGALKVFDLPFVMMGTGAPLDKSWLTGTYMYHQAFSRQDVDYASAIAILIVVLGVIISQALNMLFKEKDY